MPDPETPTTPTTSTATEAEASMVSDMTVPAEQAPPATVKDDVSEDDFDFSDFVKEDAEEGDDTSSATPKPVKPEPKAEEPKEPATPPATPPQPQVTPQPSTQADTPPATTEPAAPPPPSQEDLDAQYQDWFKQSAELLETHVYKLTEEEKQQLDTNPSQVLPRMAANLHMQIYVAATTQAANLIETMIPTILDRIKEQQEGIDEFYKTWPKLLPHRARVDEMAKAYRAAGMGQNKSQAERIQELGLMAMIDRQLPIDPPPAQPVGKSVPAPVVPLSAGSGQNAPAKPADETTTWLEELVNSED